MKKTFIYSMFVLVASVAMASSAYADIVPTALSQQMTHISKPLTSTASTPSLPPTSAHAAVRSAACPLRGDLEQWASNNVGGVVGRVSDSADPNSILEGVTISIPELKLSATTCPDGTFYFPYDSKFDGVISPNHPTITLGARLRGYGPYTMLYLPFSKDITQMVTLSLDRGNRPSTEVGSLPADQRNAIISATAITQGGTGTTRSGLTVSPLAALTPIYTSQTNPPPYIRIAIRQNTSPTGSVLRTDTVDFDYYVKHVLPNEWSSGWNPEALKAGAMAIRNYGWYFVNTGGKYATQFGADCDNSTNCQVYIPNVTTPTATDSAVDAVAGTGWYQNGSIFMPSYVAGDPGNPRGCLNNTNCMTQYGSQYWALQGKGYQWILSNYYSPTPTYWTMTPARTNPFVLATGPGYVTLSYTTAGAAQYGVFKWGTNSAWNLVYVAPNDFYTDASATSGQLNSYTVVAGNSAGWGPAAFHGGYLAAIAKTPANTPTPKVTPFFITNKEIRIKITSTDPNISQYQVQKFSGSAWTVVSNGSSNTFTDVNVSSGSISTYATFVYDPSKGWSDGIYTTTVTY